MKIDALFETALVYDIQSRIDLLYGKSLTLLPDSVDGIELFASNDEVLEILDDGLEIGIKGTNLGESKLRFMQDTSIVREILIVVVSQIGLPTADLGISVSVEQK